LQILGNVCLKLERWEEARASFEKILASKPGTEDVWLGLGIAPKNLNRQQEAVDALRKSVQASPNSAKAWHWLGWTFAQMGRHSDAIAPLVRVIELDPANASAYFQLAESCYELHGFKDALEQFQKYVALNPDDPAGHYGLGGTYAEVGELVSAVEPIRRALSIGPEYPEVYYNLDGSMLNSARRRMLLMAFATRFDLSRMMPTLTFASVGPCMNRRLSRRPWLRTKDALNSSRTVRRRWQIWPTLSGYWAASKKPKRLQLGLARPAQMSPSSIIVLLNSIWNLECAMKRIVNAKC
jgi:tetratricopeptide (TPR) repeat protein